MRYTVCCPALQRARGVHRRRADGLVQGQARGSCRAPGRRVLARAAPGLRPDRHRGGRLSWSHSLYCFSLALPQGCGLKVVEGCASSCCHLLQCFTPQAQKAVVAAMLAVSASQPCPSVAVGMVAASTDAHKQAVKPFAAWAVTSVSGRSVPPCWKPETGCGCVAHAERAREEPVRVPEPQRGQRGRLYAPRGRAPQHPPLVLGARLVASVGLGGNTHICL